MLIVYFFQNCYFFLLNYSFLFSFSFFKLSATRNFTICCISFNGRGSFSINLVVPLPPAYFAIALLNASVPAGVGYIETWLFQPAKWTRFFPFNSKHAI